MARAVAGMWDAVGRALGIVRSGRAEDHGRTVASGAATPAGRWEPVRALPTVSTLHPIRGASHHGATAARGAGRRADQGRGGALQPPPDHPGRRDGRSEAAEEREGAGGRGRWARQPGAALPGRGRCGHAGHRRVRRGRRVEPAAPGHPRPVRHRAVEGRVGARLDPGDQPVRRGAAARDAAGLEQRARHLPRLRPDPRRHGQLRHPLPGQRRRGAARQAVRLGFDLPVRGSGLGVLGGRAERSGPELPRSLPRAAARRNGAVVRRGRRAGRALRVDRLDHGQRGDQAASRASASRCSAG